MDFTESALYLEECLWLLDFLAIKKFWDNELYWLQ